MADKPPLTVSRRFDDGVAVFCIYAFAILVALGGIAWEVYTKLALIHALRGRP